MQHPRTMQQAVSEEATYLQKHVSLRNYRDEGVPRFVPSRLPHCHMSATQACG